MTSEKSDIQTLPSGDELRVTAYTVGKNEPGPIVYIQANLHGPEILGVTMLLRLINGLASHEGDVRGTLKVVPCANPIAVTAQSYGYQTGRWNQQNGRNWNRIFHPPGEKSLSVEDRLSQTLLGLAAGAQFVLDIHTAGRSSVPHLYSSAESIDRFSVLGSDCGIIVSERDYCGAFDETCAVSGRKSGHQVHAATWEIGPHGTNDSALVDLRLGQLEDWLKSVGSLKGEVLQKSGSDKPRVPISALKVIHARAGGYLNWLCGPGDRVAAGQKFAEIYSIKDATAVDMVAEMPFLFLIRHPLEAVSSGQEIAEVVIV